MIKISVLVQKKNEKTGNVEWALVSKKDRKVLRWFGKKKPSEEKVQKEEKRIQFFKHQSERIDRIQKLAEEISFPKNEHDTLKEELGKGKTQYTTRIDNELNKYEKGKKYDTPWGDVVEIVSKEKFDKIKDHPFFKYLTEEQKTEIGDEPFELIGFEKISIRQRNINKVAADPAEKTAESLLKIIKFLQYRVSKKNKKKYLNRVKGKVIKLSPNELSSEKIPLSSTVGQSLAISKNILSGLNPVFINRVLEKLIRLLISEGEKI